MILELNHVGVMTADVEASIGFYKNILGGQIVRDARSTDGRSRFVYVQLGLGIVELITNDNPQAQGFAHVAYLVDEKGLDAAYEHLIGKGFEFTVKPKVAGSGDGRLAFFKDPSGVICELIEREQRPRAAVQPGLVLEYAYNRINAGAQFEKSVAFYQEEMDLKPVGENVFGIDADQLKLSADEGGIDAIVLKVANLEETRKQLRAAGVRTQDAAEGFLAFAPSGEKVQFIQ